MQARTPKDRAMDQTVQCFGVESHFPLSLPVIFCFNESMRFSRKVKPLAAGACLGIAMTGSYVQSWLLVLEEGKAVKKVASARFHYQTSTELIAATDQALRELGDEALAVHEAVFCLAPKLIGQDDVASDQKTILADLVKELQLEPIGFVSLQEAVLHHVTQSQPDFVGIVGSIYEEYVELQLVDSSGVLTTARQTCLETPAETIAAGLVQLYGALTSPLSEQSVLLSFVDNTQNEQDWQTVVTNADYTVSGWPVAQSASVWPHETTLELGAEYAGKVWMATLVEDDPLLAVSAGTFGGEAALQVAGTEIGTGEVKSDVDQPRLSTKSKLARHKPSWRKVIGAGVVGVGLGLILLLVVSGWYLKTQSIVVLRVQPDTKPLTAQVEFTLDEKIADPDLENNKLPAEVLTNQQTATDSTPTTGTGFEGDKATGEVVILNKTDSTKILNEGTTLQVAHGSVKLVLSESIELPPATISTQSGGTSEVKTYGTKDAKVTAVEIGEEGNLAKDTTLRVGDFAENTYSATVKDNLTGGSKKQISVVTEKDIANLVEKMKKKMQEEALAEFKSSASPGRAVVDQTTIKVLSTDASAKVGDTADEVAIDLTAEVSGLAFDQVVLKSAAKLLLEEKVLTGYSLLEDSIQLLSDYQPPTTGQEGKVIAEASGLAEANIDENLVIQTVQDQVLTALPSAFDRANIPASVSYILQPALASHLLSTVPSDATRIQVLIVSQL